MAAEGYGKRAQDWVYLTPIKPLWVQGIADVADPSAVPDIGIIDLTVDRTGRPVERGANITLVLYAISLGASTHINYDATLYLWKYNKWGTPLEDFDSSSSGVQHPFNNWSKDVLARAQYSLVSAAQHANATTTDTGSLAFIFTDMPSGIYKASIGETPTGSLPAEGTVIAEQHTE